MTEDYFIRTGERSWMSMASQSHAAIIEVRRAIKNYYTAKIAIHIVEDVVYFDDSVANVKNVVASAFANGLNSIGVYVQPKFYFIQMTFLTDEDNAEFIMNKPEQITILCQQAGFYNYN